MTVHSEHFRNEQLLLDLGNSLIVSDHPENKGGSGKGPMPGELLKGALAASAAIAMGKMAEKEDWPVSYIGVHVGSEITVERRDGALTNILTLSRFNLRAVIGGDLTPAQMKHLAQLALDCGIGRSLTQGISIEERIQYELVPAKWNPRATTFLIEHMHNQRPEGANAKVVPANETAQVFAEYIGAERALLKWSNTALLVDESTLGANLSGGVRSEVLLLGALAACTSVFTARSAALTDAAAEIRVSCVGDMIAQSGETESMRMAAIVKTLEIRGVLTDKQKEVMAQFANHCAIGESLKRRAIIDVSVDALPKPAPDSSRLSDRTSAIKAAEEHIRSFDCDDGTCCIPAETVT